jgi:hypothetical protein
VTARFIREKTYAGRSLPSREQWLAVDVRFGGDAV